MTYTFYYIFMDTKRLMRENLSVEHSHKNFIHRISYLLYFLLLYYIKFLIN